VASSCRVAGVDKGVALGACPHSSRSDPFRPLSQPACPSSQLWGHPRARRLSGISPWRLLNPIDAARPFPETMIYRGLWRKIFRQQPAPATRAISVADRIEHLAHIRLALAPACASRQDHRLDAIRRRSYHSSRFVRLRRSSLHVAAPSFPESAAIDGCTGDAYGSKISKTRS